LTFGQKRNLGEIMKLGNIILAASLLVGAASANEFVGYKGLTKKLKAEAKKNGTIATIDEVKHAQKAKDWLIADVRTMEEYQAARIDGAVRIGRQNPEKALEAFVTNDEGQFIKPNVILVCNTASRASIEAEAIRQLGFKNVKIFGMVSWMDECNPVVNMYSSKKDKKGTKNKFGSYKAAHCYK
jgi:rhodanese-related sulfurtransferase